MQAVVCNKTGPREPLVTHNYLTLDKLKISLRKQAGDEMTQSASKRPKRILQETV